MKRMVEILLGIALLTGLVNCSPAEAEPAMPLPAPQTTATASVKPPGGGTVIISAGAGEPRHFNPALLSGSATAVIGAQIFASPLRYDENWNPQPYLAEQWEIAEDGLAVTLHLVETATFHDGRPITAADVAFSVMTVKKYHPFESMFAPVESVETPDPHTAVIRLSRPHPAILLAMSPALLPIIPRHVYGDGQDLPAHPANWAPVGSGPFRFSAYTPGHSVVLERHEDYFVPDRPYLDRLVFRFEPDPQVQIVDMERQEAHLLPLFLDLPGLDRLSAAEHLVVTPQGHEGLGPLVWLAFNLQREPLTDRRVRQAIAYAIDADFITHYLHQGRSQRATGPIAPDSPFYEPDVPTYELDLAKAGQLLDEAGHLPGPGGIRLSLTLDYIPLIPSQQRDVALYIRRQLAEIGIDVQLRRSANFMEWGERIADWDFDMTLDGVYNWGDPVIGVHRSYASDNIRQGVLWSNTQNYRNPRVDEILAQAEMELDGARRRALYREFQQILTAELPVIWINVMPYHTVYHTGLGNPPLSIWGAHSPLDQLYWREPPLKPPAPYLALDGENPPFKEVGVRAIRLIQDVGLYNALELLTDPDQGFLDLEGSGLHLIGFTRAGIVFLDNAGQTKPGMNISAILDLKGNRLLPHFIEAAQDRNGGYINSHGVWPHPTTGAVGSMSAWCGLLDEDDVLCALAWHNGSGGSQ